MIVVIIIMNPKAEIDICSVKWTELILYSCLCVYVCIVYWYAYWLFVDSYNSYLSSFRHLSYKMSSDYRDELKSGPVKIKGKHLGVTTLLSVTAAGNS